MESLKKRLKGYEDVHGALDEALTLLELSVQEWKSNYGKSLENEMDK